jgi:hypothetical protein
MANVSALLVSDLSKRVKTPAYNGLDKTFTSEKLKGDAQLKVSSGVHTVAMMFSDLVGTIHIQGTLRMDPTESDWMDVKLESPNPFDSEAINSVVCTTKTTAKRIYVVRGNFYWIRCVVDPFTNGQIDFIRILF